MTVVGLIGRPQEASALLAAAWRDRGIPAELISPAVATRLLGSGDVAVGRLDVKRTLDGIEPGLHVLSELVRKGVRVFNGAQALFRAHDKLQTARCLEQAKLRRPRTLHFAPGAQLPMEPPFVLKPRFGSWGADVFRCRTRSEVEVVLAVVEERAWFCRHGAIVQELLPAAGHDLRLLVAGGW